MTGLLDPFLEYAASGGLVMWPLLIGTFILWYAVGYRFRTLQRGSVRSVRVLVDEHRSDRVSDPKGVIGQAVAIGLDLAQEDPTRLRRALDDAFAETETRIGRGRVLIRSIVSVAPLLGLLGTVTGMIETFDSLGDMSLFSQSGGVAGGISQALLTTQIGLSIAVPGLIVGRLLDRRQVTLERELEQLKEILCVESALPRAGALRRKPA